MMFRARALCVALSGMSYLDLMHGICGDKKPRNVGKFPLLSVDTLAGGQYTYLLLLLHWQMLRYWLEINHKKMKNKKEECQG